MSKSTINRSFPLEMISGKYPILLPELLKQGFDTSVVKIIHVEDPITVDASFCDHRETETRYVEKIVKGNPTRFAKFKGAYVVSSDGSIILNNGQPVHVRHTTNYDQEKFAKRVMHRRNDKYICVESAVLLSTLFRNNFSHWVTQVGSTAFIAIEDLSVLCKNNLIGLVPSGTKKSNWKMGVLEQSGFSADSIIELDQSTVLVEDLYVSSLSYTWTGHSSVLASNSISRFANHLVKNLQNDNLSESYAKRIAIDRSQAFARPLSNRDCIQTTLEEHGFHFYRLEDLSFVKQLQLFYNSEIIVGEHGAGLTNLIGASNARVLELSPSNIMNVAYPVIAAVKGIQLERLSGSSMLHDRTWGIDEFHLLRVLQKLE